MSEHGAESATPEVTVWHDEAERLAVWGTLDPPDACMCRDCVLPRLLFCRECSEAKHRNCDGTAWDNEADAPAPCTCPDRTHQ